MSFQVQFSPRDFQSFMTLLNSLSDGKTLAEPPSGGESESEPSPEDKGSKEEQKEDDEKSEAVTEEDSEKVQTVSNIHVAAKVGVISLLLHSVNGNLATVSIKGRHNIISAMKYH